MMVSGEIDDKVMLLLAHIGKHYYMFWYLYYDMTYKVWQVIISPCMKFEVTCKWSVVALVKQMKKGFLKV